MDKHTEKGLIAAAIKARDTAYTPYSNFSVGAALLSSDGTVYTGCNIENAAYTPTICAERAAVSKAVSEGRREFSAIAVAGWKEGSKPGFAYPCGVCRQVLMEFCNPEEFIIIVAKSETDYRVHTLKEILPHGFGPADLV